MEMIVRRRGAGSNVSMHLVTVGDESGAGQQLEFFNRIRTAGLVAGIDFSWEFVPPENLPEKHVTTDTGWKILLDRGLDIFQPYEMNDTFDFSNRMQQFRPCKAFEARWLRLKQ